MKVVLSLVSLLLGASAALAQAEYPPARWVPTGNFRATSGRPIDLVVIHTAEGSYRGTIGYFQRTAVDVSSHYVVSEAGDVTQMVRHKDVAWHARSAGNTSGIGIECAGYAYRRSTWTEPLLRSLARLTRWICDRHSIPLDRAHIKGHVEIPGNDHTDPGPYFPWARFMALVRAAGPAPASPPTTTRAPASAPGAAIFEVTASVLNVRARPSLGGAIVGGAPRGTRVAVHAHRDGWAAIRWGGREAWVFEGYLRRVR